MKIKLIYIGRRMWNDQLTHVFLEGEKERGFGRPGWVRIGYIYEATREGESLKITKNPPELGGIDEDDLRIEKWQRDDTLAEAYNERRKAAGKAQRKFKKFVDDLPFLRKAVRGMDYFEMTSFITALVNELHKGRI